MYGLCNWHVCTWRSVCVSVVWLGLDFAPRVPSGQLCVGVSDSVQNETLPPRMHLCGMFISWPQHFGLNIFEPCWLLPTFAPVWTIPGQFSVRLTSSFSFFLLTKFPSLQPALPHPTFKSRSAVSPHSYTLNSAIPGHPLQRDTMLQGRKLKVRNKSPNALCTVKFKVGNNVLNFILCKIFERIKEVQAWKGM